MQPLELLDSADLLLRPQGEETTEANLRRAWSSIYYAPFHVISEDCADRIIGDSDECRAQRAWHQVYRALDHGPGKVRCKTIAKENAHLNFPDGIRDVAALFVTLQNKRHEADYDMRSTPTSTDVRGYIAEVREVVERFLACDDKHKKAFAAYLLVHHRDKNNG